MLSTSSERMKHEVPFPASASCASHDATRNRPAYQSQTPMCYAMLSCQCRIYQNKPCHGIIPPKNDSCALDAKGNTVGG